MEETAPAWIKRLDIVIHMNQNTNISAMQSMFVALQLNTINAVVVITTMAQHVVKRV